MNHTLEFNKFSAYQQSATMTAFVTKRLQRSSRTIVALALSSKVRITNFALGKQTVTNVSLIFIVTQKIPKPENPFHYLDRDSKRFFKILEAF